MNKKYSFSLKRDSFNTTFETDSEETAKEFYLWANDKFGICVNADTHYLLLKKVYR